MGEITESPTSKLEIDDAVASLNVLLKKMEVTTRGRRRGLRLSEDGERDGWVNLDSTQRKRKKKINKHKYKKRRKVRSLVFMVKSVI